MNDPYQKILFLKKEYYGDVYSRDCLTWTPDDRLLISCSEKFLIVNVLMNQHWNFNSNQDTFTTVVEETISFTDLPELSLVNGMISETKGFQNLRDVERQEIMSDPYLMDAGFLQFLPGKLLKKSMCSPFFNNKRDNFLIACVTFGGRVFIYHRDGQDFKPFECTLLIKKQITSTTSLPVVLKDHNNFERYKNLMHSMSTVEICWSHLLSNETSSPFFLLMTGSCNGDVHIWRVGTKAESSNEIQFEWQCTDMYQSEVMSFAWLAKGPNEGLLTIGYVDGSIRCLSLTVSEDQRILIKENMADLHCDNLSVAGMDFGKTSQGTDILVACKQYFLMIYTVSKDASNSVKYHNHFSVDSALPLTSVCLRDMYGVASPQDSTVITFEIKETLGQINIVQRLQEFENLSRIPNIPFTCCGATLSPSSALCFSVQRTDFNVPSYNRKKKHGKQIVVMNIPFNFAPEKLIQNIRDPNISSKDAVLNLCLGVKDLAQNKEDNASYVDQIYDLLKLLRAIPGDRGPQVALGVMKFLKDYLQARGNNMCPEWLSVAYKDALKERLSEYATKILNSSQALSEMDNKIISSTKAFWLDEKQEVTDDYSQRDLKPTHEVPCSICGAQFSLETSLTVKCKKGHKAILCCLSCQPCQDLNARKCETCGALALSKHLLADSNFLRDKYTCPLCGSHLKESAWT